MCAFFCGSTGHGSDDMILKHPSTKVRAVAVEALFYDDGGGSGNSRGNIFHS